MATHLRRPLSAAIGLSQSIPRRCFSQYRPLRAKMGQQEGMRASQRPDKSLRIISKGMQDIPNDMGVLQDTFIRPPFSKQPSPFSSPLKALKLHWLGFRYKMRDTFSLLVLKYSSPQTTGILRRSIKLNKSTIIPTTLALHKQMYSSFSAAETSILRRICCDGIYDSFRARIQSRPKNEEMVWELVKYNKRAKLMSNRAARYPIDGAAVRQAVVKISSRQRVTRRRNGVVVEGSGKEKDVVEYVVVQRTYANWQPSEWRVWGTTETTPLETLEEWQNRDL